MQSEFFSTLLGGLSSPDYDITFVNGTLTITPASTVVSVTGYTGVYDGLAHGLSGTAIGAFGEDLSHLLDFGVTRTHAGTTVVDWIFAGNENYEPDSGTASITITPAPLTITADNVSRSYGVANPAFTATYDGFVNGESASVLTGSLNFLAPDETESAGIHAIVPSGVSSTDYEIVFALGSLTITQAIAVVNVTGYIGTYDGLAHGLSGTAIGVFGEDLTSLLDLGATRTHAGSTVATWDFAGDANHTPSSGTATILIAPAQLTITANDAWRVYGIANPSLTYSITGFVNDETMETAGVTGSPALATDATSDSPVGPYAITVGRGSLAAQNYDFTVFVAGTLTVNRASTAVGLNLSANRPLLGTDGLTLTATVSVALGAGTPTGEVSFRAGSTLLDSATVDSDGQASLTLTAAHLAGLLSPGTHTITAEYAGDANFINSQGTAALEAVSPVSIQGMVYGDLNDNGEVDFGESGIATVTVTLTGTDDLGDVVNLVVYTDADGVYEFTHLRPSGPDGYTVTQTQPASWLDGLDTLGTISGVFIGTDGNDVFSGIVVGGGERAENYNFGERPLVGSPAGEGDTAGIGFWQNKNGQKLIKALNGGGTAGTATQLGNWLANNFPNLFGSLSGKTNAQVAEHYKTLFARNGGNSLGGSPKLDAQVMASALAVYVTNQGLAGTTAVAYGFNVSTDGTGTKTVNVGSNGAAFGVANNSHVTVMQLLLAVDERSRNGRMFDADGSGTFSNSETGNRTTATDVFGTLNDLGGI